MITRPDTKTSIARSHEQGREVATHGAVLVVDDEVGFGSFLARALQKRAFTVQVVSRNAAPAAACQRQWDGVILGLGAPCAADYALLSLLRATCAQARLLVLSGYATIETAVKVVKLGADDCLVKPSSIATIVAALTQQQALRVLAPVAEPEPVTVRSLAQEHILRVLAERNGNVSAAARALHMDRRTLQRKLARQQAAANAG